MKQGRKLEREELLSRSKSHACQPPNSPLSVCLSPLRLQINNQIKMTAEKSQQSYKGKGVQNKHHLVYIKYLIKTFLLEGTF